MDVGYTRQVREAIVACGVVRPVGKKVSSAKFGAEKPGKMGKAKTSGMGEPGRCLECHKDADAEELEGLWARLQEALAGVEAGQKAVTEAEVDLREERRLVGEMVKGPEKMMGLKEVKVLEKKLGAKEMALQASEEDVSLIEELVRDVRTNRLKIIVAEAQGSLKSMRGADYVTLDGGECPECELR